ncbi:MAG: DUF951 domain-containing protein [Thermomicrobiales bacterium]|nr:DUF951 domain-containing protein [Thermomicrobiales bacterium]
MAINRGVPIDFFLDDEVRLRKPHPCGSVDWTVVRLGADIGIRCQGCGRRVLLPRRTLEKRIKMFLKRGPAYEAALAAIEAHEAAQTTGDAELATGS